MTQDLRLRLYAKTLLSDDDSCWLWLGYIDKDGYGQLSVNDRSQRAHRMSWEAHVGPIPTDMQVLHTCDVRACINPNHLFLGTNVDNMIDRNSKGRAAAGERHGQRVLTESDVRTIRRRFRHGETQTAIAKAYGVDQTTVSRVVLGRTWRHVA